MNCALTHNKYTNKISIFVTKLNNKTVDFNTNCLLFGRISKFFSHSGYAF